MKTQICAHRSCFILLIDYSLGKIISLFIFFLIEVLTSAICSLRLHSKNTGQKITFLIIVFVFKLSDVLQKDLSDVSAKFASHSGRLSDFIVKGMCPRIH